MSNKGYAKFLLEIRDLYENLISTGLCIKLILPSTGAAASDVYADGNGTAHSYISSGVLSKTNFESLGGEVEFWSGYGSVDVLITNERMEAMLVRGLKPSDPTRIIWNPQPVKQYIFTFEDDFDGGYVSADRWTIATDGGTVTIGDAVDGVAELLTGGTDADGTTLSSTDEIFKAQTDKNMWFEASVILTEKATDDAIIYVGLADIATVDLMQDAAGGPADTLDGIGFYKLAGNLFWEFQTCNATDVNENSDMVAFVSATQYKLEFNYDFGDGTTAKVTPYVNGTAYDVVDLTISGMLEMHVAATCKTSGAQTETLKVDYIRCLTERNW